MNFRDLEYIIETARSHSFSKAAETCNVSQPSLSIQIKKIEEELGMDIFIRNKRKVRVTSFGEDFLNKAREILDLRTDIKRLADKNNNPLEGTIRLGAILTIAPYLFPEVVKQVNIDSPQINLLLKEGKTEELMTLLLAEEIDAAIISMPTDNNVFDSRELFVDPFYLAMPKTHILAEKGTISVKDLSNCSCDCKLLLLEEGHCFRSQALEVCHMSQAQESKVFTATSLETIRHFIKTGEDVTLMPALAKKDDDGLEYRAFKDKNLTRRVGIIWLKSCNRASQLQGLSEVIKKVVASNYNDINIIE